MIREAPIPTEKAVIKHLLSTLKHSIGIEYFLPRLGIGDGDLQRPHDIIGEGNKFEWDVIQGLSLQYMENPKQYEMFIMAAREIHRLQYHHKQWNGPHPHDGKKPHPDATKDGLLLGATDAILSLLENRAYQKGPHTYREIVDWMFEPHKRPWIREVKSRMRTLEQPRLEIITSIYDISNEHIGVPETMYNKILERRDKTIEMLRKDHGYSLKP
jgi:hypothetical protein